MDTKLLLLRAITLLYRENFVHAELHSVELVRSALLLIKPAESNMVIDFAKDTVSALRETILWMCEIPKGDRYNKSDLMQRIKVDCQSDTTMAMIASETFDEKLHDNDLQLYCKNVRIEISNYIKQQKLTEIVNEYSRKMLYAPQTVSWETVVGDITEKLAPYECLDGVSKEDPVYINRVNLSDFENLVDVIRLGKLSVDLAGVLKPGIQGVTDIFGIEKGIRRGIAVVIGALPGNYKSGLCLDIFRWAAMHNTPYMKDPKKKPMLLRISLENESESDVVNLYKKMYEMETGEKVNIADVDELVAARYLHDKFAINGYHTEILRINPSDFCYQKLFALIRDYERLGYEIHMLNIDYLNMMTKRGCTLGATGSDTRDLFRRVRNFCAERAITLVTPHQLSTESKKLLRNGFPPENFVVEVRGKGYWDSCGTIDQEVDIELFLHIVEVNGESYLTMQRGKHRGLSEPTPIKDQYAVFKFNDIGGIHDDLGKASTKRRKVGAAMDGDSTGSTADWFNF